MYGYARLRVRSEQGKQPVKFEPPPAYSSKPRVKNKLDILQNCPLHFDKQTRVSTTQAVYAPGL